MVISQPSRIILHIIIVLLNAASIALNALRDTLCSTYNYNIRITVGAIKHIFYTNQIHGGIIQQIVLYSFCRSMRLLFI